MEIETTNSSLMQKNVNDLTVGDAVKINLVILAVMAAIPLVGYGCAAAVERLSTFRRTRTENKAFEARFAPAE